MRCLGCVGKKRRCSRCEAVDRRRAEWAAADAAGQGRTVFECPVRACTNLVAVDGRPCRECRLIFGPLLVRREAS